MKLVTPPDIHLDRPVLARFPTATVYSAHPTFICALHTQGTPLAIVHSRTVTAILLPDGTSHFDGDDDFASCLQQTFGVTLDQIIAIKSE
jgi:hypothetical protein